MTLDDRVRGALHAYAATVEAAPEGWGAIADRVSARRRRKRVGRILTAGAAVAICSALLAFWISRPDDSPHRLVAGPGPAARTTAPRPTTTAPPLGSCSLNGLAAPSWPKSGALPVVTAADAPAAAQRFVSVELGITGVTALGGLKVTGSACAVHVQTATTAGDVYFAASGTGFFISSFNLGASSGLGLMVHGRHVQAVYDSNCTTCARWDLSVRYAAVVGFATARSSIVSIDLRGDPQVSGGYVYSDWAADGALRSALANVIPPGDFAAS